MKDSDFMYLMNLVRRDGDERLQAFYGIDKIKLCAELRNVAYKARDRREWRVPVMMTMPLDVYGTDRDLEYREI